MREQSFTLDLLNRFNYIDRIIRTAPYTLGGSSGGDGGSGGPPGGFIGVLPQKQVAGDTTESFMFSSGSQSTLVDNLNNIRAWLTPAHNFWADTVGDNTLFISSGSWYYANMVAPLYFTGGYTPPIIAPVGGDRYDLLVINSAGIMDWAHGNIDISPSLPSFPDQTSGSLPIWGIYSRSTGSVIVRYDDGINHYIYADYRPFLNSIVSASATSGSSIYHWYADGPLSSGSGIDGVYFTPQNVTVTGVDLFVNSPNSSGSTIVDVQYSSDGTNWISLFTSNPLPTLSPGTILDSFATDTTLIPISNVVRANIIQSDDAKSLSINLRGIYDGNGGSGSAPPATDYHQAIFTLDGALQLSVGSLKIRNLMNRTLNISRVYCDVGTAPTGSNIIIDINKNGTTIFTDQSNRPVILNGTTSGETTNINVSSWFDGEYLTMDIDAIGSITIGSDLTVTIIYQ